MMKKWLLIELKLSPDTWNKASITQALDNQHMLLGHSEKDIRLKITKKSLGGGKGKQIGNDYERRIAAMLSKWWGCTFRRSPSSGGWDKLAQDGQVLSSGDLYVPPEANFPFSVECKKRRETVNLFNPTSEFFSWWEQCCRDAATVCKSPLLIFNTDGTDYCALPEYMRVQGKILTHRVTDNMNHNMFQFVIMRLSDMLESQLVDTRTGVAIKDGGKTT